MHRIELIKTHTHAGKVHCAGSVIAVDEITANWLIERGVGQRADPGSADTPIPPQVDSVDAKRSRRNEATQVSHHTPNKE